MTTPEVADAKKVLLAAPRGYCAGVDRAVETVERALEKYGAPVYVRKEIVHNRYVVDTLAERGAIFVDETTEVPEGSHLVFSAHGVSPAVHAEAKALSLETLDATCPLVTKVHNEVKRFARDGYQILLIGHEGHEELKAPPGKPPMWCTLWMVPRPLTPLTLGRRTSLCGFPKPRFPWTKPWRLCSYSKPSSRTSPTRPATTSATPPKTGK